MFLVFQGQDRWHRARRVDLQANRECALTILIGAICNVLYNRAVRRLMSLILLALFGLPLAWPAMARSRNAGLPVCCRRAGAHRCMGSMQAEQGRSVTLKAPLCSSWPLASLQARHGNAGFVVAGLRFGEAVSHPSMKVRTLARARMARDQARRMRGPPVNAG